MLALPLNFRSTGLDSAASKAACKGLTSSNIDGSSKLVAEVIHVMFELVAENVLSIELREEPLTDLGIKPYVLPNELGMAPFAESARPALSPNDRGIALELSVPALNVFLWGRFVMVANGEPVGTVRVVGFANKSEFP